jgi:hypothetical protein
MVKLLARYKPLLVELIRTALRGEGHKVSGNAIAKWLKFGAMSAFVLHIGFAFADSYQAFKSCMED